MQPFGQGIIETVKFLNPQFKKAFESPS